MCLEVHEPHVGCFIHFCDDVDIGEQSENRAQLTHQWRNSCEQSHQLSTSRWLTYIGLLGKKRMMADHSQAGLMKKTSWACVKVLPHKASPTDEWHSSLQGFAQLFWASLLTTESKILYVTCDPKMVTNTSLIITWMYTIFLSEFINNTVNIVHDM